MERKPTRPVPVPSGKKKKKKDELDLALASIRQSADTENQEEIERVEPSDDPLVGKRKREDVTDEQFDQDTQGLFEPSAYDLFGVPTPPIEPVDKPTGPLDELVGKVDRFTQLMDCWKSSSAYDPEKKVDLAWLETNVGPHFDWMEKRQEPVLSEMRCPFHPSEVLKVLNPEAELGPLY